MDERSRQDLLESAENVRLAALYLQQRLMRGGDEGFLEARREYERLVERFRRDHPDAVTERQSRNALEDLDYFLILVEQAIDGYRRDGGS
ncbi:MAG: hypothetical protein HPY65_11270 [Syntrophaceae bacterium]|nr:hypothetical protein [Syntrophaceae bacterium]